MGFVYCTASPLNRPGQRKGTVMSAIAQRQKAVEQMNANSALEDLHPDATDRALQRSFIAGTVTIEDLLQHARQYAAEARQRASSDGPR